MFLAEETKPLYHINFDWSTFIGQLVGFAAIVYVIMKWVVPAVRSMMVKQQDTIRRQLVESQEASARLSEAKQAYQSALNEAEMESARIREDARADAEQIADQLRLQADSEVARVSQHGRDQVVLSRAQLIRELKADLGTAAVDQAGRRVREHLDTDQAKSDSVDRFLDELEAMVGAGKKGQF